MLYVQVHSHRFVEATADYPSSILRIQNVQAYLCIIMVSQGIFCMIPNHFVDMSILIFSLF